MRKFVDLYKEKLNESESRREAKILNDFQTVYNAMLEHYGLKSVNQLNERSQTSFLTELNRYWSEESGLSEKGQNFLEKRSMELNESSTATQKKNFLRVKSYAVINETLRQSNLRNKLYDVVDEIYTQTNAKDIRGILPVESMESIIAESFQKAINSFLSNISTELNESVKASKPYKK
jgi:hypothetical protein